MRGLAADDRPETDHRVVGAGGGHALGHQGDLERPRNPGHVHRVVGHAVRSETREGSLQETGRHVLVEARDDDGDAAPLADRLAP